MDSRGPSRLSAELSQVMRERPDGVVLRSGIVNAVQTAVFPRPQDLMAAFSDAAEYAAFLEGALELALFPHARLPQRATSLGIHNRTLAWDWVVSEIRTHVGAANWTHQDCFVSIADIFPNAVILTGKCRFPLYITGDVAREWNRSTHNARRAMGGPFGAQALSLSLRNPLLQSFVV